MTWSLVWMPSARDDLAALPRRDAQRIIAKVLQSLEFDPPRAWRRLKGDPASRLRVGDYRVLADLDADGRTVTVLAVGHRRNVYDPR